MSELTDEEKKVLEELKRYAREPKVPIQTPNMGKFTDPVLVPAEKYRDWHEVIEKKERRPPKEQRSKKPAKK